MKRKGKREKRKKNIRCNKQMKYYVNCCINSTNGWFEMIQIIKQIIVNL